MENSAQIDGHVRLGVPRSYLKSRAPREKQPSGIGAALQSGDIIRVK